ncbi:hypothetical protein PybrP1_008315 [[Pythium] brassicae (nom. inval.)]|nr:hypothetical protein PybrP1_008315 [[Pythium] brassicae (nom. inval.)]
MPYNGLAERHEFDLPKRPHTVVIMDIVRSYSGLRTLPAEQLTQRRTPSVHFPQLDTVVVDFIVLAEMSNVDASSHDVMIFGKSLARALQIPRTTRPRLASAACVRQLLARYGIRSRRAHSDGACMDAEQARAHAEQLAGCAGSTRVWRPKGGGQC